MIFHHRIDSKLPCQPSAKRVGTGVCDIMVVLALCAVPQLQAAPQDSLDKTGNLSTTSAADPLTQLLSDRGLTHAAPEASGQLVVTAMAFLGLPYKRGGNSFDTGFDCSGFVKSLYEQTLGKILPRSAAEQAAQTLQIGKEQLQPGDLVFFNTMRRAFSHVGIYIGEGKFIHSPKPGAQVRIEDMSLRYWNSRFNGARRVE